MNAWNRKAIIKSLLLLFAIAGIQSSSFAQNLAQHNWYFGNSKDGIRFNRADNKSSHVANQFIPFGTGGSAVATDPATADLLFYTDGASIIDASHNPMANGAGLTGLTSANQPAAICAVPGQTNKYFVFTNNANYTSPGIVSFSVVDMALPGNAIFPLPALGAVDGTRKNITVPGLTGVAEGMITIPHANGKDFWLITQNVNSQSYNATLITAASYTLPATATNFITKVGSPLGKNMIAGNISYYNKFKKLIIAPQNPKVDILILSFDNTILGPDPTVPFTFDSFIPNSGVATTGNKAIYDTYWDSNGQYIYYTVAGEPGVTPDLFQFDYTNATTTLASVLKAPVAGSFGLQEGPDSTLYYLYEPVAGTFLVDKLTRTDTIASSVIHTPFDNTVNFSGTQFPSFLPKHTIKQVVDFTFDAVPNCQNTPTNFYPNVTPNADSLLWSFGDGKDTVQWSAIHTYTTSGSFPVTLTAFYQGQKHDTTHTVTITAFTLKAKLVSDTTACECQLPARKSKTTPCTLPDFSVKLTVQNSTAQTKVVWSNGDTGLILTPDSAGYYYAVITDPSTGCSTYAGVNVKEFALTDRRENIWYFGNHAGIDFNKQPAVALNSSAMDAPEGCSIACDRNGQVIFYTDGSTVWDKNNLVIATGIGGDPLSAESALIIPVPGDETLYYIFTTEAIDGASANEMKYSLYDLKQNAVVIANQVLFTKSTEHITGNKDWLIAHEYGNNTFRAYPITSKGIGDPVYSAIGTDLSLQILENGQGYMRLSSKNNLAVTIATPGVSNFVELFDFNDTTGVVTKLRKIDLKTTAGLVYGVEFSDGGNKMFVSVDVPAKPSLIYEYSIDSIGQVFKPKMINSVNAEVGALVLGPDLQIYVAINDAANNSTLGLIQANNDTTKISAFQLSGFPLKAGTNSRLGLPNFRQLISSSTGGPDFTFEDVCIGDSTHFVGTSRDPIDFFTWDLGEGPPTTPSQTKSKIAHLYTTPGKYTVKMTLTNRCPNSLVVITHVINVRPKPAVPSLPGTKALCNSPIVLDANIPGTTGLTYKWSTGETTQKITVNKAIGALSVTNTDQFGCSNTATGAVGDSRPKVDLGPDQTLCQGTTPPPVLNVTTPGATYQWTVPSGVTASATGTQNVDVSSGGSLVTVPPQKYAVKVTVVLDPVSGTTCSATDDVTFTVSPTPTLVFTKTDPTGACGSNTAQLHLTLTGPDNNLFTYTITGPTPEQGADAPKSVTPIDFTGVATGAYTVLVTNQLSLCTASGQVAISDAAIVSVNAANVNTCTTIPISVTNTNITAPFSYTVKDAGGVTVDSKTGLSTNPFSTIALPVGTYTIQVNSANGCVGSTVTQVNPTNPQADFTVIPDLCANPMTLTAVPTTGAPTFSWVGPNILGATTGNTISIAPPTGPATYTVTGGGPSFCPKDVIVNLNIPAAFTPSFTQTGECTDQVTLTASPTGSIYTYNWYVQDKGTGVFTLVGNGPKIFVNDIATDVVYALDVTNGTGCPAQRVTQPVSLYGLLSVGITATPACDNGSPFTLTGTTNGVDPKYKWSLNDQVINNATLSTLQATAVGKYTLTVTTAHCEQTANLTVIQIKSPVGKLPSSAIICDDPDNHDNKTRFVKLDPGLFATYQWYQNGDILADSTQEVIIINAAGTYTVDLTNEAGCTTTDKVVVSTNCEPVVNAPTAFRPSSSDSDNKDFQVFTFFILDDPFQIFIYNRWGELIYTSASRTFKWNGTMQTTGEPTPGGTYAYVIKYTSSYRPEQGIQEKHGGVVLLR